MNTDKNFKNTEITKVIKDTTKKTTFEDFLPKEIEDKIQLTCEINPNLNREMMVFTNSESGSLLTVPTINRNENQVFYVKSIWINVADQSTNQNDAQTSLVFFTDIYGATQTIACTCGNGGQNSIVVNFDGKGVPLPPMGTVSLLAGDSYCFAGCSGYIQDNSIYTQIAGGAS